MRQSAWRWLQVAARRRAARGAAGRQAQAARYRRDARARSAMRWRTCARMRVMTIFRAELCLRQLLRYYAYFASRHYATPLPFSISPPPLMLATLMRVVARDGCRFRRRDFDYAYIDISLAMRYLIAPAWRNMPRRVMLLSARASDAAALWRKEVRAVQRAQVYRTSAARRRVVITVRCCAGRRALFCSLSAGPARC